jgi:hypothetical protein
MINPVNKKLVDEYSEGDAFMSDTKLNSDGNPT